MDPWVLRIIVHLSASVCSKSEGLLEVEIVAWYMVCAKLCMLLLSLHACCVLVPFERDEDKDFE